MNFEEFKTEVLSRAKLAGACSGQYKRALESESFEQLAEVIKDNLGFNRSNSIVTPELIKDCDKPEIWNIGKENTGLFNSGYRNSGDLNSGYRNSGDLNSGDLNSGDLNSGYRNSGDRNSGNLNSGYRNSGDLNSGDRNSGDLNSGYRNSGDLNSGDRNSGDLNSGDLNSGYRNSGYRNSGDLNSGYRNSGDRNSGDRNSGDLNSGDLNSGYRNSGVFCNKKRNDTVLLFNKESSMTWDEWYDHPAYDASLNLELAKWVSWNDMSDEEKKDHPKAFICEGYLKTFEYKEAWSNLWLKLSESQKESFRTLPNFNSEIFKEITGIDF